MRSKVGGGWARNQPPLAVSARFRSVTGCISVGVTTSANTVRHEQTSFAQRAWPIVGAFDSIDVDLQHTPLFFRGEATRARVVLASCGYECLCE
jgi:hypothetical protein